MANPFSPPLINQPGPEPPPLNPLMMAALMPPTSPSLGFQAWASDPKNNHKVVPAMTAPDAPLQPNAGMAAANPPKPTLMASAQPPALSLPDTSAPTFPSMATPNVVPSGPASFAQDQAANPGKYARKLVNNGKGAFAEALVAGLAGAAGGLNKDPMAGLKYAQGVQEHDEAVPGQNQALYQNTVVSPYNNAIQQGIQNRNLQSQIDERNATTRRNEQQAENLQPIVLTPEQATAIGYPDLAGHTMDPRTVSVLMTGNQKVGMNNTNNDTKKSIASDKNQTDRDIADARNKRMQSISDAKNKTELLLQGMKDSTSRANTSDRLSGAGAAGGKVPADVTKRAALANNVNENAGAVESLINSRPDIVGAAGGRYTNVQQMIGSNDPDIQELGVRIHNIALASNGAHGVRSAQAIEKTENELFNNFKTGPQGIAGALKGTQQSVQTFLDDEKNFQTTGSRTGSALTPPAKGATNSKPDFVYVPGKGMVKQ